MKTYTEYREKIRDIIADVEYQIAITESHNGNLFSLSIRNKFDEPLFTLLLSRGDLVNIQTTIEKALDTKLKCVLCNKEAITTAAHIPVCEEHHNQYAEEGRQYLSYRPFYEKLQQAYEKRNKHG